MATMIPAENTLFPSPGEKEVYDFFQRHLKPDGEIIVWHAPLIDGKEPDFLVLDPKLGLIVFEVKDWVPDQFREADLNQMVLAFGDHAETKLNPIRQARQYAMTILNSLKKNASELLSRDPEHQGKLKFPVTFGVILTRIFREELYATNLDSVIDPKIALCADDVNRDSPYARDPSGRSLRETLAKMFPPLFRFSMSPRDVEILRRLVWPQVRLATHRHQTSNHFIGHGERIEHLDTHQESLARRLDSARAILAGPAGSGKTLVLIHKAILEQQRGSRSILFICFNITLKEHLKRLLAEHRARLGANHGGVQVYYFYEFCQLLLGESLTHEKESADYYKLIVEMANSGEDSPFPPFQAIFVDEGQDLSDDMIALLKKHLAPGGIFWVANDESQVLYDIPRAWTQDPFFRVFNLHKPYRAASKLLSFTECLRTGHKNAPPPAPAEGFHGDISFREVQNEEEGARHLVKRLHNLAKAGIPRNEIFVLYATKKSELPDQKLTPAFLVDKLEESGILATWVSQDHQSKKAYDVTTDRVAISTIHSLKGLDATAVFLWGLDRLDRDSPENALSLKKLAYVAATRARGSLEVIYFKKTPIISHLLQGVPAQ
ncbi:MAG: NERD domain-containing protein [Deltaproteobacteria bacterium]|jgi:hypothetical protein|nr:NERD domain-containing protein [Deltaproteobacteria bacterium]